ncbi:MAG TPA: response regulator transcription factor [Gemmatimonadaceae bacterium]|nr:response regulator transcription factor [Gemmatimonadaceae bacterium]
MTTDIIRVVLADDHAVVRAGLKAVLGVAKDIQVVGEVANGADAVAMTEKLDPDVLILDLSMPQMGGAEVTKVLAAQGVRTRILILTMHSPDEALVPLLESGASGFLQKSAADRELVDAVRAVAHGDTYLQPSAARVLAGGLRKKAEHNDERTRYERLTQRERDVLRLVAQGYSAPEIGERLFISPKTVDTYKQRIQEKMGLQHRSQYIQFALNLGLLTQE